MRVRFVEGLLLLFLAVEARAQYDPGSEPPPKPVSVAEPQIEKHWYGWQTLAVDGVAAASFAYAVEYQEEQLIFGSLMTFLLVPPIVHATHDRLGAAGASLGMRFAVPMLFVLAGLDACSGDGPRDSCTTLGFYGATGVGAAIVSATDAILLGSEPVKPAKPTQARVSLTPSAWVDSRGARLTLSARF